MQLTHYEFAYKTGSATVNPVPSGYIWTGDNTHGTHVGGIMAAARDNFEMHGVAYNANLLSGDVLSDPQNVNLRTAYNTFAAKPAVKKPAARPAAKAATPAAKPAAKPATKPAAKTAAKPAAKTTAKPAAKKPVARRAPATRLVKSGDVVLGNTAPKNIAKVAAGEATDAAMTRRTVAIEQILDKANDKIGAMQTLLARASKDEVNEIKRILSVQAKQQKVPADEELNPDWRKGGYPYKNLMSRKNY